MVTVMDYKRYKIASKSYRKLCIIVQCCQNLTLLFFLRKYIKVIKIQNCLNAKFKAHKITSYCTNS